MTSEEATSLEQGDRSSNATNPKDSTVFPMWAELLFLSGGNFLLPVIGGIVNRAMHHKRLVGSGSKGVEDFFHNNDKFHSQHNNLAL